MCGDEKDVSEFWKYFYLFQRWPTATPLLVPIPQSDSCVVVWSILRCYYVVWLLSNNTEPCQVLLVLMPCSSTADISLKLQTNCQPEWHQPHKLFLYRIIEILFLGLVINIHIKGNLKLSECPPGIKIELSWQNIYCQAKSSPWLSSASWLS